MPRIQAPTVAEHRAQQERLLLDVAHEILEETGVAPSMKDIADRSGLARSSVYHYFGSREDLLQALIRDIFPRWAQRVTDAMHEARDPGEQILAYAIANLELVHEGAHAVGSALAALAPGAELDEQAVQMHRAIQEPLVAALRDLRVEDPEQVSDLINAIVHAATRSLDAGVPIDDVRRNLTTVIEPMATELLNRARRHGAQT